MARTWWRGHKNGGCCKSDKGEWFADPDNPDCGITDAERGATRERESRESRESERARHSALERESERARVEESSRVVDNDPIRCEADSTILTKLIRPPFDLRRQGSSFQASLINKYM